jgi:hypothetical protein
VLSFKIGESLPASANPTLRYLSEEFYLKFQQDIQNEDHLYCSGNASAWTSEELEETYAIMNPFGAGLHLDRGLFEETMRSSIPRLHEPSHQVVGSSAILTGKVISVAKVQDEWEVMVEVSSNTTKSFRSKYLVEATGRKASVAQRVCNLLLYSLPQTVSPLMSPTA